MAKIDGRIKYFESPSRFTCFYLGYKVLFQLSIYIYIYKTETFETSTIFHVSTIFKLNFPPHHYFLFPMQIRLLAK